MDYRDPSHQSSVDLAEWLESLPVVVREYVEESVEALLERAAAGEIAEHDDRTLEPVMSFPLMYELKWHLRVKGKPAEIRQYHGEPPELPEDLVVLHRHRKNLNGPKRQQLDTQNAEMSQAQLRSVVGIPSNWGTGS